MIGDHILLMGATLAPQLQVGVEGHTNPFQVPTPAAGAVSLLAKPGLQLSIHDFQFLLEMDGGWSVRKEVLHLDPDLSPWKDGHASITANLHPHEILGVTLEDAFTQATSPADPAWAPGHMLFTSSNHLLAGIDLRPGPAFRTNLAGEYGFERFGVPSLDLASATVLSYGPRLDVSWQFFPRTALIAGAGMNAVAWDDDVAPSTGLAVADPVHLSDGTRYWVGGGATGRFLEWVRVNLLVGKGVRYNRTAAVSILGTDGILARAEVEAQPTEFLSFTVAYRKDFLAESFPFDAVAWQRATVGAAGTWSISSTKVEAGWRRDERIGDLGRLDDALEVSFEERVALANWALLALDGGWSQRFSTEEAATWDGFWGTLGLTLTY